MTVDEALHKYQCVKQSRRRRDTATPRRHDGVTPRRRDGATVDDALHQYLYLKKGSYCCWSGGETHTISLVRRLKQTGVQCGTEYIDKRCDGLAGLTVDEALHKYQYMKHGRRRNDTATPRRHDGVTPRRLDGASVDDALHKYQYLKQGNPGVCHSRGVKRWQRPFFAAETRIFVFRV